MPSILNWLSQPGIRSFAFLERTFINLTRLSRHSLALSIPTSHKRRTRRRERLAPPTTDHVSRPQAG